jgi:hypothetical protein
MLAVSPSTNFLILTVSAIALFARYAKRKSLRPLNFPPGPKGLPFFGSVLDINASEPWLTFTQWASTYGPCHAYTETYDSHVRFVSRRPGILHSFRAADSRHSDHGRRQSTA